MKKKKNKYLYFLKNLEQINIVAGAKVEVVADEVKVSGNQTTKVGPGPYYSGVLSEPLFALLKTLASSIDAKMPATPSVNATIVDQAKNFATSKNVIISK